MSWASLLAPLWLANTTGVPGLGSASRYGPCMPASANPLHKAVTGDLSKLLYGGLPGVSCPLIVLTVIEIERNSI